MSEFVPDGFRGGKPVIAATARRATLPMYDFPDARAATDAWWAGVARHLARAGVTYVPPGLLRGDDLLDQWRSPGLVLSQTCGYILTHQLRDCAQAIAVPIHAVPGCSGPTYRSFILVPDDRDGATLADFRGSRAVYSRTYSHAGYNIFRAMIAPLAGGRPFFASVGSSDSHLGSIAAVQARTADIATIDCVVHAFVARYRPHLLHGTRTIGLTPPAPAPPYIVPVSAVGDVARVRSAIFAAAIDPDLASARDDLFIAGFADAGEVRFGAIDDFEAGAVAVGYPLLR